MSEPIPFEVVPDTWLRAQACTEFNKIIALVNERHEPEELGRLVIKQVEEFATRLTAKEAELGATTSVRIKRAFASAGLDPSAASFGQFSSAFRTRVFDALDAEFGIKIPRERCNTVVWLLIKNIDGQLGEAA